MTFASKISIPHISLIIFNIYDFVGIPSAQGWPHFESRYPFAWSKGVPLDQLKIAQIFMLFGLVLVYVNISNA